MIEQMHESAVTRKRSRAVTRVLLAGPGAACLAALVLLGMPLWVPGGVAGINNLVLPLVLLPLVWAAAFFHACLDEKLWRVAALMLGLGALHGAAIVWHFAVSAAT